MANRGDNHKLVREVSLANPKVRCTFIWRNFRTKQNVKRLHGAPSCRLYYDEQSQNRLVPRDPMKKAKTQRKAKQAPTSLRGATRPIKRKLGKGAKRLGDGATRVTHREYLMDVMSATDFNVQFRELNPGLRLTFPWLHAIAMNYDFYKFVDLRVSYSPTCSTLTAGNVMMAIDFDVNDYPPTSKQQLMSYAGARRCAPWDNMTLSVPKLNFELMSKERNPRETEVPDSDLRLYDLGCLYLAIGGCVDDGTALGELYVEYTVDLWSPQLQDVVNSSDSANICGLGGITKDIPLGTSQTITVGDNYDPIATIASNGIQSVLNFKKAGEYLASFKAIGSGLTTVAQPSYTDLSALSNLGVGLKNLSAVVDGTSTGGMFEQAIKIDQPGSVGLSAPDSWTTLTGSRLRLAPYKFSI